MDLEAPALLLDPPGPWRRAERAPTVEPRPPVVADDGPEARCERGVLRCATINTHRGRGPIVEYLTRDAAPAERERVLLLHETRAYAYCIADWMARHRDLLDVVALQEVFNGLLGFGDRLLSRYPQHAYYRAFGGYPSAVAHGVGFAGFRYENLLLSRLPETDEPRIRRLLPGRVWGLAACGFTLAPYRFAGRTVWIGNTHLHACNPRARAVQAASIARTLRALGDVPILFLGDLNTVPPGCKDGDFPHGDRDARSYRDDATLGLLARAGLRMEHHADEDAWWTYPVGLPNRTLDYILFSRHWEVESYDVIREFRLSDHYPVIGEFRLRR